MDSNSLSGTIPSMSALTRLGDLNLTNNYLTMGLSTSVPTSTFSSKTLTSRYLFLENNCLAFSTSSPYPSRSVTATHCRPTSKYQPYNYMTSSHHRYYLLDPQLWRWMLIITVMYQCNVRTLFRSNNCIQASTDAGLIIIVSFLHFLPHIPSSTIFLVIYETASVYWRYHPFHYKSLY